MSDSLSALHKLCPDLKVKVETESEGAFFSDIAQLNTRSASLNIELAVKVSGVEALRDLYEIARLNISYFIAPMVESVFGCSKFVESLGRLNPRIDGYILVESATGIRNFQAICDYAASNNIKGIIIGRTDLAKSIAIEEGLKLSVDSPEITQMISDSFGYSQSNYPWIVRAIGGSVSRQTVKLIPKHFVGIVDYVETRKVIMPVQKLMQDPKILDSALAFELDYLRERVSYYDNILDPDRLRLVQLGSRL
jgi:4-hydroxy-2-oxoheptanedioate aldolase